MKIHLSKAEVVAGEASLYVSPGSAERDRQAATEGETKHEQHMIQMNGEARCGTAARLPHTNTQLRGQSCAVLCDVLPLYCLSLAHTGGSARPARPSGHVHTTDGMAGLLADLAGLVSGLYSSDAALKLPSTSLSTSSLIPVRAGAGVRRVVAVGEGSGGCEREDRGSQRHGTSGDGGRSEGHAKP